MVFDVGLKAMSRGDATALWGTKQVTDNTRYATPVAVRFPSGPFLKCSQVSVNYWRKLYKFYRSNAIYFFL